MKFPGYMLIVWDFVNFAKQNGIPVGPGRGSAAGSLVAYSLRITNIDPLKYDLLFERFLNPERVSMPDIDMDFSQERRQELIEYVSNTYGKFNVAQVVTFNSLLAKGVIRDVARVLDMPLKDADGFAKLIPNELGITLTKQMGKDGKEKDGAWEKEPKIQEVLDMPLKDADGFAKLIPNELGITLTKQMGKDGKEKDGAWEKEPKIQELVDKNPLAKQVWDYAVLLEGLKRNTGIHAAAIVIDSNDELWNKVPLYTNDKMNGVAVQYSMNWLEPVDLIKFDFLGLKTLDVISDAIKLVKKRYGVDIDFSTMDMEDAKVYETIQSGSTLGLFQIESEGMQALAKRLKPSNFEDVIAMISLYRPGPMDLIDDFVARKHGLVKIEYLIDTLESILKPTYGIIVYQEQVMQIVQTIGGFSLGIVIDSNDELWNKVPLYTNDKMNGVAVQYSMNWLEPVDLIKFDFLGLKTLDVISDAIKLVKKRYGVDIDFSTMDMEDAKVYETIQSGSTLGLFQIESEGMQALAKRLKPSNFEDVIAMISLYRPGPMDLIDDFVARKHGLVKIEYLIDTLESILKPTYGIIVYQEQVMQIVQTIGGFSLGGADLVRRAMGKKKLDEMLRLKKEFADGAEKQGYDRSKAEDLWELIVKFAGYGFNKSHAAAYGMITYQTAYLKTYYEHEFMAAMLTSETNKVESVAKYINEVESLGIEIIPPHVNTSVNDFGVGEFDGVKKIIFGLGAIKGLGEAPIENIITEREKNGEYKSVEDFIARVDFSKMTKRSLEPLIKSGGLDGLGFSRHTMLENIDLLCDKGREKDKAHEMMSNSLFGENGMEISVQLSIQDKAEYDIRTLLDYEYECMGIYISGHPLDDFKDNLGKIKGIVKSIELEELEFNSTCMLVGKILDVKRKISKKSGKPFGTIDFLDYGGKMEVMVFEKHLEILEGLNLNHPLALKCKIEEREERLNVRILEIFTLEQAMAEKSIKPKYKTKQEVEDESQKIIPLDMKPSELDVCTPLCVVVDSSCVQNGILDKLKAHSRNLKGTRELRLKIKNDSLGYTFVSHILVHSSIKEAFKELEWQE